MMRIELKIDIVYEIYYILKFKIQIRTGHTWAMPKQGRAVLI
jgi:hypothetical protein